MEHAEEKRNREKSGQRIEIAHQPHYPRMERLAAAERAGPQILKKFSSWDCVARMNC